MVDLFEKAKEKKSEEIKKSVNINPAKHHKRYGTKKPPEKFNKQEVISNWRDDI